MLAKGALSNYYISIKEKVIILQQLFACLSFLIKCHLFFG